MNRLDHKRETLMMLVAEVFVLTVLTLLMLCSCASHRETSRSMEARQTHDTVHVWHHDTVTEVRLLQRADTVRELQERVVTLREGGDTLREVVNNYYWRSVVERDSNDYYKKVCDSLRSALSVKDTVRVEKKVVRERRWGMLDRLCYLVFLALAVYGIYLLVRPDRKGG